MTIVSDISLQFLKWRFKTHPGAKRAYDWIQEDIAWDGIAGSPPKTVLEEFEADEITGFYDFGQPLQRFLDALEEAKRMHLEMG